MSIRELLLQLKEKYGFIYCLAADSDAKVLASCGNRNELHWDSLLTVYFDDGDSIGRLLSSLAVGQSDIHGQGDVVGVMVRAAPRLVIGCFAHRSWGDFSIDKASDEIVQMISGLDPV
jgi:hypothetical protein